MSKNPDVRVRQVYGAYWIAPHKGFNSKKEALAWIESIKAGKFRREVRQAVADYIASEGCSCCEGHDHKDHKDALGKLLNVKKYSDGSGYDFAAHKKEKK